MQKIMTLDDKFYGEEYNLRVQQTAITFYIKNIAKAQAHDCYVAAFKKEQAKINEEGGILFNLPRFYDSHRSKLEKVYLNSVQ